MEGHGGWKACLRLELLSDLLEEVGQARAWLRAWRGAGNAAMCRIHLSRRVLF